MKDWVTKDSGKREEYGSGARRDVRSGKGRYDLLSPMAIRRIAGVYERGAEKYGDRNYEKGMPLSRFLDSALRHLLQYIEGKQDEDHAAQAAWNILSLIHTEEMINRGILPKELNDLPSYMPSDADPDQWRLKNDSEQGRSRDGESPGSSDSVTGEEVR
jgi:hypothetical protein